MTLGSLSELGDAARFLIGLVLALFMLVWLEVLGDLPEAIRSLDSIRNRDFGAKEGGAQSVLQFHMVDFCIP